MNAVEKFKYFIAKQEYSVLEELLQSRDSFTVWQMQLIKEVKQERDTIETSSAYLTRIEEAFIKSLSLKPSKDELEKLTTKAINQINQVNNRD